MRLSLCKSIVRVPVCGYRQLQMNRSLCAAAAPAPAVDVIEPSAAENEKKRHTTQKYGPMGIHQAVSLIKSLCWAKFDETIEISLNMGLDPRKPNQSVKGTAKLPSGNGKKTRICVFAQGSDAKDAQEAGADVVGADDLIAKFQGGDVKFDTVIATPEMMSVVGKIGRILGPRGLMPNPRMGTVTKDVAAAVKTAKAGVVQFKVEKKGIIQAGMGKRSFTDEELLANIRSFMNAVYDGKPEGLKGKYMRVAHLSSTMGPSVAIELPTIDPSSARFMLDLSK